MQTNNQPDLSDSSAVIAPQMTYTRVRVSAGVEEQLLIRKTSPVYPAEARAKGIQGAVTLLIIIDKQGRVMDVNSISGDPMLVPAAMNAVRQWRYKEYVLNGKPVEVETTAQVDFRLKP